MDVSIENDLSIDHDVLDVGTTIKCKKRSGNALTCDHPLASVSGELVFVKVAPVVDPRTDSILVDTANGLIMRRLDPHSVWSVHVRGINRCVLRRTAPEDKLTNVVTVPDTAYDAPRIAMSIDVVTGSTLSSSKARVGTIMRSLRTLVYHMIAGSSKTGMTHNDMHCGNVMINEHYELRVIDYGRMQFGRDTIAANNNRVYPDHDFGAIDDIMLFSPTPLTWQGAMTTWADPFQAFRDTAGYQHLYWVADLITLSMNVFKMVARGMQIKGQREPKLEFLQPHSNFMSNFVSQDVLAQKLSNLGAAFNVLKPGLALYAIMLKEYELQMLDPRKRKTREPRGTDLVWDGNYTVLQRGGRMLQKLFSDGTLVKKYGTVLSSVFNGAGLYSLVRPMLDGHPMSGGSGPMPEYDDLDTTGVSSMVIDHGFPRSLEEAHEDRFRKLSVKHPNHDAHHLVETPWHMGGGAGGPRALVVQAVLAAVVVAASFLPR